MNATVHYEPCEECGAPMDPQQRYCVNCAARRGNGANPSSRYFAAMSKRARRPIAGPRQRAGSGSRAAAVGFFALLPIAVAIGVVVGRAGAGNGDEAALLQALRERDSSTVASSGDATAGPTAKKANAKANQVAKKAGKPHEKVAAKTKNGAVHEITGYVPSKKTEEEATRLVENNVEQTGGNYVKAQQNLPDVIPVGGDPSEAPPPPTGKGQP
jgi:hypothetical protein